MVCVAIAAYTTELIFPRTDSALVGNSVCYRNPKAEIRGPRICHSLMGAAISSIMVCMVLMIFDVFIPCVDTMVIIMYLILCITLAYNCTKIYIVCRLSAGPAGQYGFNINFIEFCDIYLGSILYHDFF